MTLFVRFKFLLLSALSAHEIAGGSIIHTPNFIAQLLGIGIVLFCFRSIKLEGPTLALLVLFIQSTSHFLLGGGSFQNETRMTFAHLLSGVLSYLAISKFEVIWEFISTAFIALIPTKLFLIPSISRVPHFEPWGSYSTYQLRFITSFLKFRGPPLKWISS